MQMVSLTRITKRAVLVALATAVSACGSDDTAEPANSGGSEFASEAGGGHLPREVLYHLYVGCRDTQGTIQHYRVSSLTGKATLTDTVLANAATSNFAVNADKTFVYVAHADEGRISTFARHPMTGTLTLADFVAVPGNALGDADAVAPFSPAEAMGNPATQTLELDAGGNFLLASNYYANTVLVYSVNADGTVGDLVHSQTDGLSSHHTVFSVDDAFVLVPYFGSNFIATYAFDSLTGHLSPVTPIPSDFHTRGSGPRHLAFDPTDPRRLYSINETAGSISLFSFDTTLGSLGHQATVSSLPEDSRYTFEAMNRSGSEIEIDHRGMFLYVSNRLDGIANGLLGVYSISRVDGTLTPLTFEDTRGKIPRHFSLAPGGELLVVANQGSDNISVFKVDEGTGELSPIATSAVCDSPFFARMVAPAPG